MSLEKSTPLPWFTGEARWIWSSEGSHARAVLGSPSHYEVRRFRRVFRKPTDGALRLLVAVSADSRYVLYCNGKIVSRGPAKGDIRHHFYEEVELTSLLNEGENILCAVVMDFSKVGTKPKHLGAPTSVMCYTGGFVLSGIWLDSSGALVARLASDRNWKVSIDQAYRFQNVGTLWEGFIGYFEDLQVNLLPDGWLNAGYDESRWQDAFELYEAESYEERRDPKNPYGLLPRMIPLLEEDKVQGFSDVFMAGGGPAPTPARSLLEAREGNWEIPANSDVRVIFDTGFMTTAFPVLLIEGGAEAVITIQYSEALRLPYGTPGATLIGKQMDLANLASGYADSTLAWTYDHRGKMDGWCDIVRPDGREFVYEPFHWRTFRFVQLHVKTASRSLRLSRFFHRYTAYPYEIKGTFSASEPAYERFWQNSMRTMQLCSHETFEDGPFYEQMQYAGDTAITAKISMWATGDTRLTRQALYQFDWSRLSDGPTHSRYPSRYLQVIPSWSLHWVQLMEEYYMYCADKQSIKELIPGAKAVMEWFQRHIDASGLPSRLPYWNTADWCPLWQRGQPPGWDTGPTCVIAAQYVHCAGVLSRLARAVGDEPLSNQWETECLRGQQALVDIFWSEDEGLFTDRPGGPEVSQYGNAWAILAGAKPAGWQEKLSARYPHDPVLAPVSFFGMHAVLRSLRPLGSYEQHFRTLMQPWFEMVELGLDTWAEETSYWRSLCHAWSGHPALEFMEVLLGVTLLEPGCSRIQVEPLPSGLSSARGTIVLPQGLLHVSWEKSDKLELTVNAPPGVSVVRVES